MAIQSSGGNTLPSKCAPALRRALSRLIVMFLAATVGLSCTERSGDAEPAAVAGDTLRVVGDSVDQPLGWTLTPDWSAGAADSGAMSFTRVSSALVGTAQDGLIRVLDPGAHRIVVLDSSGVLVGVLGRRGRGPGEFEFPSELSVAPNGEVAVIDLAQRAAVRLARDGAPLPLHPIPFTPVPNGSMRVSGDSVIYDFRIMDGPITEGRWRLGLLVQSPRDTTQLTLVRFPIQATRDVNYGCHADRGEWPLFTPRFRWAIGGGRIAWTEGSEYRITVHTADGPMIVSRAVPARPSTLEHARRAFPSGQTIRSANGPCVVTADQMAEQAGLFPTLPQITGLSIDPTGALFVERWSFPDEGGVVDVFDPSGRYRGTMTGRRAPVAFLDSARALFAELDPETDARRLRMVRIRR